jgi:hypothetical protein
MKDAAKVTANARLILAADSHPPTPKFTDDRMKPPDHELTGRVRAGQIRNPKSEGNSKLEIRKSGVAPEASGGFSFEFRISFGFRVSDFRPGLALGQQVETKPRRFSSWKRLDKLPPMGFESSRRVKSFRAALACIPSWLPHRARCKEVIALAHPAVAVVPIFGCAMAQEP